MKRKRFSLWEISAAVPGLFDSSPSTPWPGSRNPKQRTPCRSAARSGFLGTFSRGIPSQECAASRVGKEEDRWGLAAKQDIPPALRQPFRVAGLLYAHRSQTDRPTLFFSHSSSRIDSTFFPLGSPVLHEPSAGACCASLGRFRKTCPRAESFSRRNHQRRRFSPVPAKHRQTDLLIRCLPRGGQRVGTEKPRPRPESRQGGSSEAGGSWPPSKTPTG